MATLLQSIDSTSELLVCVVTAVKGERTSRTEHLPGSGCFPVWEGRRPASEYFKQLGP